MHELSITQSILDIAVSEAARAGATSVSRINLVIGDMSSVADDCVQFYFDFLSRGSLAEGARLSFRRVPLKARCRKCGAEFQLSGENWKCPQCRDVGIEIIAGNEFFLESIEVET